MNYTRFALASLAAFVAYFMLGGLMFALLPLRYEVQKYPAVYRSHDGQISHMPAGMLAILLSMAVLTVIYAMLAGNVTGWAQGARLGATFGALIGLFAVFAFVIHNWVNLNIGFKLAAQQAAAYFVEWTVRARDRIDLPSGAAALMSAVDCRVKTD
jgi:hypothetical protein